MTTEITYRPAARNCKVCGTPKGTFHKCCPKCSATANGIDDIETLFGWRDHKEPNNMQSHSWCRSCRSNKIANKTSTAAVVAAVIAAAVAAGSDPKPVVEPKPVVATVDSTPAPVVRELHRMPIAPTVAFDGDVETLTFGPIGLAMNAFNTVEGATMVPTIDPHYKLDVDEVIILANAIRNAEATWIWGHSGTGKTSGVVQIHAMLNRPLYRVNMSGDFSLADFVGSTEVVIDEATKQAVTRFVEGVLIRAMLNGGTLLIDEITATPPHILMALQAVLERVEDVQTAWDNGRSHCRYVNTANGGEVIHAAKGFRVIVTDNTNGQGDVSGMFAGTNVMNEAFRSRFTQWFQKDFPGKLVWRQILTGKTGIDSHKASKIVEIAQEINKGSAALGATNVTNNMVLNPRDTLAVARHTKTYGSVAIAWKVGFLNSLHPTDPDRVHLSDLIRNIVGTA